MREFDEWREVCKVPVAREKEKIRFAMMAITGAIDCKALETVQGAKELAIGLISQLSVFQELSRYTRNRRHCEPRGWHAGHLRTVLNCIQR